MKKQTKIHFTKENSFRNKLKKYIFLGFLILVLIYFIFRLFDYVSGPQIILESPKSFTVIQTETFTLKGQVKNAKNIYINGREIQITENGDFEETIIAKSPYIIVTIRAIDRYGKETMQIINYGVDLDEKS